MRKVIIDCDPGIDDTLALSLAVKSPDIEVVAITVVCGNVPAHLPRRAHDDGKVGSFHCYIG